MRGASTGPGHEEAYAVVGNKQKMGESIRTVSYRYNYWGDGSEELYDQKNDPEEYTNLASSKEHSGVLENMRALLAARNASF